jgi:hypothetical protein
MFFREKSFVANLQQRSAKTRGESPASSGRTNPRRWESSPESGSTIRKNESKRMIRFFGQISAEPGLH